MEYVDGMLVERGMPAIVEGARYRIPDLLLCPIPLPAGKVITVTPVIEILSPDDRMGETLERFRDYAGIGAASIVQMDPERHLAHVDATVPFDSEALFAHLRAELEEATAG